MTKYLLDTTALIDHLRGRSAVVALLSSLAREGHQMGLCCVNVAELYAGLSPQEQAKAERLMDSLDFYHVSREAAKQAGRFRFEYARRGVSITTADALIASAAIEEGAVLVTANVRDFPMTALQRLEQP